jgi:hypothetical protein
MPRFESGGATCGLLAVEAYTMPLALATINGAARPLAETARSSSTSTRNAEGVP